MIFLMNYTELILRQHRTKTIYWILHVSCLHIFRHIAQFVLARRQPCVVLIVQSDEKSDCAIHAQSLCGIALNFNSFDINTTGRKYNSLSPCVFCYKTLKSSAKQTPKFQIKNSELNQVPN